MITKRRQATSPAGSEVSVTPMGASDQSADAPASALFGTATLPMRYLCMLLGAMALFSLLLLLAPMASAFEEVPPLPKPQIVALPPQSKQIDQLQLQLEREFAKAQFKAAVKTADRIYEAVSKQRGDGHKDAHMAQVNLANAHLANGDYKKAGANYHAVIKAIKERPNYRDPELAAPLFGIGLTLYHVGRYEQAADALGQAAFVTRAEGGLENLEQFSMDNVMIRSLVNAGKIEEALDRLDMRVTTYRNALGPGDQYQAMADLTAQWYRVLGEEKRELRLLQEKLRSMEKEHGRYDPILIPTLYAVAEAAEKAYENDLLRLRQLQTSSFPAFERPSTSNRGFGTDFQTKLDNDLLDLERQAAEPLERARKIQRRTKNTPAEERALTEIKLGNHDLPIKRRSSGIKHYKKAYKILKRANSTGPLMESFDQPQVVHEPKLYYRDLPAEESVRTFEGKAELSLTVTKWGTVQDVKVISIEPQQAQILEGPLVRMARGMLFRPQITDDGPQTVDDYRYVRVFRYRLGQAATIPKL